jgi:hypothetical protein
MFAVKPEQPLRENPLPQIRRYAQRYCGSEFIRESFIPDAANVLDVSASSRMNPPKIRRYARATVGEFRTG